MSGEASNADEDYSDFLPWLEGKAGAKICSTLSIRKSPIGGRGLFASENIKKGDRILRIPHSVQLSQGNLPSEMNTLLGKNIDPYSAVAVLLLLEKNLGQASKWAPYISSLYETTLHNSVLWNDEELEMIRPSCLYEKSLARKKLIEKEFMAVKSVVQDTTTTLEEFTYAYLLVRSRAWDCIRGIVLIPFADFINHDVTSEADVVDCEQHSEITADRDYAAGEEFFISYGTYSNATLLLSFGFTIRDNPYVSLSSMEIKIIEEKKKEGKIAELQDEISKLISKRDEHMMKLVESSNVVRRELAVQLVEGELRVLKSALARLDEYRNTNLNST